jgi:hypothetical protein
MYLKYVLKAFSWRSFANCAAPNTPNIVAGLTLHLAKLGVLGGWDGGGIRVPPKINTGAAYDVTGRV